MGSRGDGLKGVVLERAVGEKGNERAMRGLYRK
jgi:hypothetical protein